MGAGRLRAEKFEAADLGPFIFVGVDAGGREVDLAFRGGEEAGRVLFAG